MKTASYTRIWLRLEGAAVLAASITTYAWLDAAAWWLFAVLLLVPDVSMLGYLAGPRIGAHAYNLAHAYVLPLALAIGGLLSGHPLMPALALIWTTHIGLDRMLGYGLKEFEGFRHTHLGPIGAEPPAARRAG